ncbi:MAG: MOSC domain-containing protein [Actinomycetota bacterium]
MWEGTVHALYTASESGAPIESRESLTLIPGVGVAGDRYAIEKGHFSDPARTGRELTLIEQEAIEAVARDYSLVLEAGITRRNVLTRGVALNHLVGRRFFVGEALVEGVRLNEPCNHLAAITGLKRIKQALTHRGGLRARVIKGGVIRPGDTIRPV